MGNQLSNSEIKKRNCYNTPMPALEKNFEDLSLIRGNDKRHESGNSSSSSCSINDNDSALSSMSSEDESFLLNFSHVENALLEDKRPKFVHQRQRSRHFIEPLISKSEGPVAQFFRPVLDKERMFLSTVQKDGSLHLKYSNKIVLNWMKILMYQLTKTGKEATSIFTKDTIFQILWTFVQIDSKEMHQTISKVQLIITTLNNL